MSLAGQRIDPRRYQLLPRALVFAFRDGRVLLQRVPANRGAWSGLWNGVGGHIEQGESPADAARREFFEETGLTPSAVRLAGTIIVDVGSSPGIGISVFTASAAEGREVSGDEGELQWFSLEETASLPAVEDLPTLLPRVARFLEGAPPFSAVYNYDATGKLNIRIDG
jgi:8-oxo-dGTP diphosphatase